MVKDTRTEISYADLRQQCLEAIKQWPGCETVTGIQLIRDGSRAGFSVKVTLGGRAGKIVIDRATACVEREMRRRLSIDRVSSPGLVSGVIPVAPNPPEQGERRRIG